MPPLHRKYDPLTVIVYVFFFYFIIILFFFFLGYTFVSWHFVIAIYGAHLCFAVAHVLPLRANTWYTLYYFRLALLLGPLEMPVLNTTKLVSFALGVWIQFASISFLLFFFVFSALRCQLPEGRLTLPMACPSANALLVTITYTHGHVDVCLCVCANACELVGGPHMLLYWHSIWVIAIFSCSYAFFCQWKWIFLLFTLSIVVAFAAAVVVEAWMQPRLWDFNASLLLYLGTFLCAGQQTQHAAQT